jgi:hypothetical protein
MREVPDGATMSDDGHYWWDAATNTWVVVQHHSATVGAASRPNTGWSPLTPEGARRRRRFTVVAVVGWAVVVLGVVTGVTPQSGERYPAGSCAAWNLGGECTSIRATPGLMDCGSALLSAFVWEGDVDVCDRGLADVRLGSAALGLVALAIGVVALRRSRAYASWWLPYTAGLLVVWISLAALLARALSYPTD